MSLGTEAWGFLIVAEGEEWLSPITQCRIMEIGQQVEAGGLKVRLGIS